MIAHKAPLAAALGLLLTVSGLGAAAFAGVLPNPLASHATTTDMASASDPVEVFTGDAGNFTDGYLDLRVTRGNVLVEAWNQSTYEIAVYQVGGDDGYELGDAELDITFDEYESDGAFGLLLQVAERGTASMKVGGSAPEIAVMAKVPDLHWREAVVCSAGASGGWTLELGSLLGMNSPDECVDGGPSIRGSFQQGGHDDRSLRVPFEVRGLSGGKLAAFAEYANIALVNVTFEEGLAETEYGNLEFENVAFQTATVQTEYGALEGSLDAPDLIATTEYGAIDLTTRTADLVASSEYGNVRIVAEELATGSLDVTSEYGNVVLVVPQGPGYNVHAETEYGDVRVRLAGLATQSTESDDNSSSTFDIGGLDLVKSSPRSHDHGDSFDGRTDGYEDAAVQVEIDAVTEYGNVLITDAGNA